MIFTLKKTCALHRGAETKTNFYSPPVAFNCNSDLMGSIHLYLIQ